MRPVRSGFLPAVLLALAIMASAGAVGADDQGLDPVRIDFFFEPGCSECARVKAEVLPELEASFAGFYELSFRDIGIEENYLILAGYQDRLGVLADASVSMVVDGLHVLNGYDAISTGLFPLMNDLIAARLAGETPAAPETGVPGPADSPDLTQRVSGFTLAGVLAAGLVDGINPCAISTLVFFISLLSVLKVSGRRLVIVGSSFCIASFVTYTAIGFGLLRALHLFSGFSTLQKIINTFMIGILFLFSILSFRDAYRYHRSGKPGDVSLQLPDGIKLRIHRIMRGGLGAGSLLAGSLFIGASVTALESVCTGQVYIPTLVMVIKSGGGSLRSYLYLLLYNLMFMVPIVTVFILTVQGLKAAQLMAWSKRSVVVSKTLMGVFFIAMAGLIAFL